MTLAVLREYVRGVRTQEEVAREMRISVRTLQRIEDEALAYYLLGIARAMREALGDEQIPACRISENPVEHREHAERAASSPMPALSSVIGGRARQLPRRFRSKP